MIVETYTTRARCNYCGAYLWTNPGSANVACGCSRSEIIDNVRLNCSDVVDEPGFKAAVAVDRGVPVDDVTVEAG